MTERTGRKRRPRVIVPSLVVTAATVGTTGLALVWSIDTAPVTPGSRSAASSAVALEIAREKSGIAQLHRSITATMSQIDALHTAAAVPGQAGTGTTAPATPGGAGPTSGQTGVSAPAASTVGAGSSIPAAAPATAAAPTSAAPAASVAVPVPASTTPAPTSTPTTQPPPAPPPPPPPPPVTTTTGASHVP